MAALPPIKRFRTEDYENLDEKFIINLNIIVESLINAVSGNLNHQNIAGDIFERKDILKNTTISPSSPLKIQWTKSLPPASVVCGGIWKRGADSTSALGLTISIEWDYDTAAKILLIKRINGLSIPDAVNDYQITLKCDCK